MTSLLELHEKYDAIKARAKWVVARSYLTEIYPLYFEPKRQSATKILEIGVCFGGSVCALRDYFPNAQIVGADIELYRPFRRSDNPRITLIQADQGNVGDLKKLGVYGPYDFIIEDGSHEYTHQKLAMDTLPAFLKSDGVLFIEDVVPRHKGHKIEKYAKEFSQEGLEVVFHPGMIAVKRV